MVQEVIEILTCGLSSDKHIVYEPIHLSCGEHYGCKECIEKKKGQKQLKCSLCKLQIKIDTIHKNVSSSGLLLLKQNLGEIYNEIYKRYDETYNNFTSIDKSIDSQIDVLKEQVDMHIDSIITELKKVKRKFNKQFDDLKSKFKNHIEKEKTSLNIKSMESQLKQLKYETENKQIQYEQKLHDYQTQIKTMKLFTKNIYHILKKVDFNLKEIDNIEQLVGSIDFSGVLADIEPSSQRRSSANKLEYPKFTLIEIDTDYPADLSVLANEKILLCDFKTLRLYNDKFELVKTVSKLDNEEFNPVGLTVNERNEVFVVDCKNKKIFKTDSDLNKTRHYVGATNKQLNLPFGICYKDNSVFVCDHDNKRVVKLTSDLEYEASYPFDYNPLKIKILNNTVCIREKTDSLYFHSYPSFTLECKYNRAHTGLIGVSISSSNFFEYSEGVIYCYDVQGEQSSEINVKELDSNDFLYDHSSYGGIVCFNQSLILYDQNLNRSIIKIPTNLQQKQVTFVV